MSDISDRNFKNLGFQKNKNTLKTLNPFIEKERISEKQATIIIKKRIQKNELLPLKGGTKIEGRGGRKNVLKRTKTNARTAQTHVLLNAKYLNFPIRCKN